MKDGRLDNIETTRSYLRGVLCKERHDDVEGFCVNRAKRPCGTPGIKGQ